MAISLRKYTSRNRITITIAATKKEKWNENDKTDNGNYQIKGLEEQKISVLFGKKEYNAGDRAIVARIKDDLNIISEE